MIKNISEKANAPDVTQVALYMRVSTGAQAQRDLSIPNQRSKLEEACRSRNWTIVAEYTDVGTATNDQRTNFQAMIGAVRDRSAKFKIIFVHSFSRFFRDEVESELYIREMKKYGVELISLTQEIGDGPVGDFIRRIFSLMDEHSSRETSKHVSRTLAENAKRGYFCGGLPPFGYQAVEAGRLGDAVKKKLAVVQGEATMVRRIFELFLLGDGSSGPMGVKNITVYLNEHGHLYRSRRRWGVGEVHRVLTDSAYHGAYLYKRSASQEEQVLVPVPPIISREAFDEAQVRLRERNPRKTAPRTVSGPTLLAGTAKCGHCGAGMILQTGKGGKYRYYCCSRVAREGKIDCRGVRARMDEIDHALKQAVSAQLFQRDRLRVLLSALWEKQNVAPRSSGEGDEAKRAQLAEVEARRDRLWDMAEKGLADPADPSFQRRMRLANADYETLASAVARQDKVALRRNEPDDAVVDRFAELIMQEFFRDDSRFARLYLHAVIGRVVISDKDMAVEWKPRSMERHGFRRRNGTLNTSESIVITRLAKA